ncbi:MAG TPA: hypothetical protein VL137_14120, partial [Polyangiaceae bacterium]|nr:hypothetical protein [Polyangiaceae bacterium]
MKVLQAALLIPVALGAVQGCGGDKATGSSIGTVGSHSSGGQTGSAGTGSGGTPGDQLGGLGNGTGNTPSNNQPIMAAEVCATITADAAPVPVDMYIMLDQSASMAEMTSGGRTRWAAVTEAISSFVADPRAAGIGVGIDYFGIGIDETANCVASNYSNPDVPIAALPGNSGALTTSLGNALGPNSGSLTPTYAALDGALQYATQHAMSLQTSDPTRETFVVLATDGFPTQCDVNLPDIAGLAHTALTATPSVQTHVIALKEGEANARAIAEAGGGKSFVINDTDDVTQKFLDAMLSITASTIPCFYDLPRDSD